MLITFSIEFFHLHLSSNFSFYLRVLKKNPISVMTHIVWGDSLNILALTLYKRR